MEIEFDPMKEAESGHGLPFDLAAELFEAEFIDEVDDRADYGETRFIAIGPVASFGGRLCVAVYTWRGSVRRVISFRKANDREIRKYRTHHP